MARSCLAICAFPMKPLRQDFSISINVPAHFAPNSSSGDFRLPMAIIGKPSLPCLGPIRKPRRRFSSVYSDHWISTILPASFWTALRKAVPTARPSAVDEAGRSSNSNCRSSSSFDSSALRVLPVCFCFNLSNLSSFCSTCGESTVNMSNKSDWRICSGPSKRAASALGSAITPCAVSFSRIRPSMSYTPPSVGPGGGVGGMGRKGRKMGRRGHPGGGAGEFFWFAGTREVWFRTDRTQRTDLTRLVSARGLDRLRIDIGTRGVMV